MVDKDGQDEWYNVTSLPDARTVSTTLLSGVFMNNETFANASQGQNVTKRWINLTSSFYDDLLRPIVSLCMGLVGLPAIVVLISVMSTAKYRRYSYTLYLSVMSVYDFVFILIEFIESLIAMTMPGKMIRSFLIWDASCKLFEHVYYTSMTLSMWLNVAVAVDRFIVIAFPFKKDVWCNRRNSWIVTLGMMLIVHSIGIVYLLNGKVIYTTKLNLGYYCTRNPILTSLDVYLNYIGGVVSAMLVICFFTVLSVAELSSIRKRRQEMTSNQPTSTKKDKTSRATVALVAIGVSAFLTQTPYIVNEMVRLYARHYDRKLFLHLYLGYIPGYKVAVKIFEAGSFFINIQNFFFMFALNGPFRRDVINMLTCRGPSSKKEVTSTRQVSVTVVSE